MTAAHIVYRAAHGGGLPPVRPASDEGWWPPRRRRPWNWLYIAIAFLILLGTAVLGVVFSLMQALFER